MYSTDLAWWDGRWWPRPAGFWPMVPRGSEAWWERGFRIRTGFTDDITLHSCFFRLLYREDETKPYTPCPFGWIGFRCEGKTQDFVFPLIEGTIECPFQGEAACKIEIKAMDMAGNVSRPDEEPFNIDWTPAEIEIVEPKPRP